MERIWTVLPDPIAVAEAAAARILGAASRVLTSRDRFRLVLAGGGTPLATYRLLSRSNADWARWEIFFGDERCLAPDHPERNSRAAWDALLDRVPIPAGQVAVIPAEMGAEPAAQAYQAKVRTVLPFDLVLLGMGEDGHTASLFPGRDLCDERLVLPVHDAPKPPRDRVTLSLRALSDSLEVLVLATGAGKRDALRRWQEGEALPVAQVRARQCLEVLMDRAAAGRPD